MSKKHRNQLNSGLGLTLSKSKPSHKHSLRHSQPFSKTFTSITDQSSLENFLFTAELAGRNFAGEKENLKIITHDREPTSTRTLAPGAAGADKSSELFTIPRRPEWTQAMSSSELNEKENEHFLDWRARTAQLESAQFRSTPFENNLEVWRQLWRVVEKSDLVVQVLDARDPLLFRCPDLEKYAREVDEKKRNFLLINKSDLLTQRQREFWSEYFTSEGIQFAFWSANQSRELEGSRETDSNLDATQLVVEDDISSTSQSPDELDTDNDIPIPSLAEASYPPSNAPLLSQQSDDDVLETTNSRILTREELISLFTSFKTADTLKLTVGMIGYPNVGKSSSINRLLSAKKVAVSAIPGKTKHFQTLLLNDDLVLCDCPGLVFPNRVASVEQLFCAGILPIDQMRNCTLPIAHICRLVPKSILEYHYRLRLAGGSAEHLLTSYALGRGLVTAHGQADFARAAKAILKDFVQGHVLFCTAPPGVLMQDFNREYFELADKYASQTAHKPQARRVEEVSESILDSDFFNTSNDVVAVYKYSTSNAHRVNSTADVEGKPWKKHFNHHKKEKIRRKVKH